MNDKQVNIPVRRLHCVVTLPKLPLPRTLMKLKSLRFLLGTCPFSLPAVAEDEEEEEVVEEEDEEVDECWAPCWLSDSTSCRRSSSAKSVGVTGNARQTYLTSVWRHKMLHITVTLTNGCSVNIHKGPGMTQYL